MGNFRVPPPPKQPTKPPFGGRYLWRIWYSSLYSTCLVGSTTYSPPVKHTKLIDGRKPAPINLIGELSHDLAPWNSIWKNDIAKGQEEKVVFNPTIGFQVLLLMVNPAIRPRTWDGAKTHGPIIWWHSPALNWFSQPCMNSTNSTNPAECGLRKTLKTHPA